MARRRHLGSRHRDFTIAAALSIAVSEPHTLHFLITAGPTREPLDPVRFLSNRSSGKMGFAIASAAAALGHKVELIAGPVTLETPPGNIHRHDVISSDEMADAVQNLQPICDVFVFCAAVADFKPANYFQNKIKRAGQENYTLELVRTRDILRESTARRRPGQTFIGFAAETHDLAANAVAKLISKDCDLIAANDVSSAECGFEVDTNALTLYFRSGIILHIPQNTKAHIASILVKEILQMRDSS